MSTATFNLGVADPSTGESHMLRVPARTADEALEKANQQGWLVSTINGAPASAAAAHKPDPVGGSGLEMAVYRALRRIEDERRPARILARPVMTIAAGVFCGSMLVAGFIMAALMLLGVLNTV